MNSRRRRNHRAGAQLVAFAAEKLPALRQRLARQGARWRTELYPVKVTLALASSPSPSIFKWWIASSNRSVLGQYL